MRLFKLCEVLLHIPSDPEQNPRAEDTCCFSDNSLQPRKWPQLYRLSNLITHFVKTVRFPNQELEFLVSILDVLESKALMSLRVTRVEVGLWVVVSLILKPQKS